MHTLTGPNAATEVVPARRLEQSPLVAWTESQEQQTHSMCTLQAGTSHRQSATSPCWLPAESRSAGSLTQVRGPAAVLTTGVGTTSGVHDGRGLGGVGGRGGGGGDLVKSVLERSILAAEEGSTSPACRPPIERRVPMRGAAVSRTGARKIPVRWPASRMRRTPCPAERPRTLEPENPQSTGRQLQSTLLQGCSCHPGAQVETVPGVALPPTAGCAVTVRGDRTTSLQMRGTCSAGGAHTAPTPSPSTCPHPGPLQRRPPIRCFHS